MDDDLLKDLEKEYAGTKVISIVVSDGALPRVEWTDGLSENDVIATLIKAVLFMTIDDFMVAMVEDMFDGDDDEDDDDE